MRRLFGVWWVVLSLSAVACVPQDLAFRQDTRLEFVSPADGEEVEMPVVLEWTMSDFDLKGPLTPDGGSFAVFLDRAPVPPGEALEYVARDDTGCVEKPRCPSEKYLAKEGVYETTNTRLRLRELPAVDGSSSGTERHYATIILLDSDGLRIGEISYGVAFEVPQEGES